MPLNLLKVRNAFRIFNGTIFFDQQQAFKEAAEHPAEKRYIIIIRIHGKKFFLNIFLIFLEYTA